MTLCLVLSCRLGVATDADPAPDATSPASPGSSDLTAPATPAMMALPVNPSPAPANVGSAPTDASTSPKFYTITASLRETYDDNVNTSNENKESSLETQLSPSILVNFPTDEGDFSGRYTFNLTYYSNGGGNGGGNNQPSLEYTHEFIAQYSHAFSDRFNLNLAEQFRYYTEPSLFESTGTNYRDGAYVANTLSGTLSAHWTPLFGTTTTYSNTIIRYDEAAVALDQNNVENTGSQVFSLAILPKISLSFGGIVDEITYDSMLRGYTSYTGFTGLQWQALPSLSLSGRGGASYTETAQNQALISPYAALSLRWKLGLRSALSFDYAHEVTPTDQVGANAQTSDRFSANFNYDITSRLSSHLQGIVTQANISQSLINTNTMNAISSYNEDDYGLDTGLTFHYNNYLDFNFGISLSGVISEMSYRTYDRQEAYMGVRGTY